MLRRRLQLIVFSLALVAALAVPVQVALRLIFTHTISALGAPHPVDPAELAKNIAKGYLHVNLCR